VMNPTEWTPRVFVCVHPEAAEPFLTSKSVFRTSNNGAMSVDVRISGASISETLCTPLSCDLSFSFPFCESVSALAANEASPGPPPRLANSRVIILFLCSFVRVAPSALARLPEAMAGATSM